MPLSKEAFKPSGEEEIKPSPEQTEERQETKEIVEIPEEFKEWPSYLKKRFEVVRAGYALDLPKFSELLEKEPDLAKPELLSLLSYWISRFKKEQEQEGKQPSFPVLDKKTFNLLIKNLPGQDLQTCEEAILLALGNLGEKKTALGILEGLANDKNPHVRKKAAQALGNLGNLGQSALEILKRLAEDESKLVRVHVAQAISLGKLGKPGFEILDKLAQGEDPWICIEAARALGKLGEKKAALEILEKIAETKDEKRLFREEAILALGELGKPAFEILKRLVNDKKTWVREAANWGLVQIRFSKKQKNSQKDSQAINNELLIRSFVFRQEPLFANPVFGKEMQGQLLTLSDIIKELQQKYPNLIGLSVLGSFSKGYYLPGQSDLDWGLIYQGREILEDKAMIRQFQGKAQAQGFRLCDNHSIDLSQIETTEPRDLEIAFNGVFIGKRKKLREAQPKIIKQGGPAKWQGIRKAWRAALWGYAKVMERFNLTKQEEAFVRQTRKYLWELPEYEVAKREFV